MRPPRCGIYILGSKLWYIKGFGAHQLFVIIFYVCFWGQPVVYQIIWFDVGQPAMWCAVFGYGFDVIYIWFSLRVNQFSDVLYVFGLD